MKRLENDVVVSGVAYDDDVLKVTIYNVPHVPGVAAQVFSALGEAKVNVDMIIQSGARGGLGGQNDISFTTSMEDDGKIESILQPVLDQLGGGEILVQKEVAKVSIIGAGMITNPGVAAKMFRVLSENGHNIQMIATSEIKVSCILKKEGAKEAVAALHTAFDLDAE